MPHQERSTVIIGAGPAGLTAAYTLAKSGVSSVVLESDSVVGGIARTAEYKGYLFDIGGHRFFTKVKLVDEMWREVLGNDFLKRPRLSRIHYGNQFYWYPLKLQNVVSNLGILESARCFFSYVWARIRPDLPEVNFEQWVSNRFGKRLYLKFFKSYTEKVWGIPCTEIQAEWAAQRIKGLSFSTAVKHALQSMFATNNQREVKTLIGEFDYPRRGPGMMWERTAELVEQSGSQVLLNHPVTRIDWEPGVGVTAVYSGEKAYRASHYISSMPIRNLLESLSPAPPKHVLEAARQFQYRDFLTVALVIKQDELFPDNWIYIHDPEVLVGRIQNFKNWSPEMVPDPAMTCLGLEYFCFEGDGLWTMKDEELIQLGREEVDRLGLAKKQDVVDGVVVRMPKAYPVYDSNYKSALTVLREFLPELPNLQLVGRNGMHHYNNQDHSMLTAVLAARNVLGATYDLWKVNAEDEYHESGAEITEEDLKALQTSQPMVPERVN